MRERMTGVTRSLTILLFFCLGVVAEDGVAVGRGEGTGVFRGDGAALGRGEGTAEPFAFLVRILSLGAGRGIGDGIAGGVAMAEETLMGNVRAGVGFGVATGTLVSGMGTCVTCAGAGVAAFLGGIMIGGLRGISGDEARESFWALDEGNGEAFVDTGAGDEAKGGDGARAGFGAGAAGAGAEVNVENGDGARDDAGTVDGA